MIKSKPDDEEGGIVVCDGCGTSAPFYHLYPRGWNAYSNKPHMGADEIHACPNCNNHLWAALQTGLNEIRNSK